VEVWGALKPRISFFTAQLHLLDKPDHANLFFSRLSQSLGFCYKGLNFHHITASVGHVQDIYQLPQRRFSRLRTRHPQSPCPTFF
jgi:hypothetical protein